jgi:DNA-binding response OmpR family regulator
MRVLVVEDEAAMADALERGLSQEGFAVDVAADGTEGLWRAIEIDYDLVVLDLMLPELSGYEVLRRMRAAERWSPVLVLTAKDGEHDIGDALDLGADDYLVKPFSYVVLLARIRALLRRGRRQRPVALVVGDLVLDPATRRCQRGGADISLTSREFAVLEYLMRAGGVVVGKRELLEHIWDENFDGDPNIVEVYIGYLRRKIDDGFGRNSIVTIRGAGYQLVDDA